MKPIIKSVWTIICTADGKEKWRERCENVVTDQGLAALLDVMFLHGTQITDDKWFVALIESGSVPTTSSTYAVPIYTESTAYDEATRPSFVGVRSSLTLTNSASLATFTISATKTIIGGALVGGNAEGSNTKGNTASTGAVLYCAIELSEEKYAVDNDVLTIQVDLTAAEV
jgi:hypothetical protein